MGSLRSSTRPFKSMLTKLVEAHGNNWERLLGQVLLAYHTTLHSSNGETQFFLMYGRDCQLPTGLDSTIRVPTIESDYAKELFTELKIARKLAKQNIGKGQVALKTTHDKEACNKEGDLVMPKVELCFKLDRSFRGPYHVHTVTNTCAHIRPINKPNDNLITGCPVAAVNDWAQPSHGWAMGKHENVMS